MSHSWRSGCPEPLPDLRLVRLTHWTFDDGTTTGELIVHKDVAQGVERIFKDLFKQKYPIRSMQLIDDFKGEDDVSMAADNTSAFNCRTVARSQIWSEHSYGRAIDLNPLENPWVRGNSVLPPKGAAFRDRPHSPGVIHPDDDVVLAFAREGWKWGGYWTRGTLDYQHFSVSGR